MDNKKLPLEINLDKIVIGSSLEALLCAFYNKLKIIYTRSLQPDEYDIIEDYGLGTSRREAWNKHIFQLSIAGYIPFSDKIKHIRYCDKNILKVITNEENVYTVKFNEIYVFDDYNFLDLPPTSKKTNKNLRILDWFKIENGDLSETENISNKSKFINQIIIDEKKDSDLCVISYTKENKLDDYPEHLVRIKTESELSSDGKIIELVHVKREIKQLEKELYEDFDNVTFSYAEEKYIYLMRRWRAKIDYMKYFRIKLGIANDRDE